MKRKRNSSGVDSGFGGTPKKKKAFNDLYDLAVQRRETRNTAGSTLFGAGAAVAHAVTAVASAIGTVASVASVVAVPGAAEVTNVAETVSTATEFAADILSRMAEDFKFSQKILMSNPLFVDKVKISNNKKAWPKKASGAVLKLDHTWANFSTCPAGNEHHTTLWLGEATLNYTGTPTLNFLPNINFFDLNPSETLTGSTIYDPAVAGILTELKNPRGDKIFAASAKGFIDISNQSNIGVFYRVTYYRCKLPTNLHPIDNQQTYMQSENLGIATVGTSTGALTQSAGSIGYHTTGTTGADGYYVFANGYVGLKPDSMPDSKKTWGVENSKAGYLVSGGTLRHFFEVDFHEVRSKQFMTSGLKYQKGSMVAVISFHGEPVKGDMGSGVNQMCHAPCSLGYVGYQRLTYSNIESNQRVEPVLARLNDPSNGSGHAAWTQETSAAVSNI